MNPFFFKLKIQLPYPPPKKKKKKKKCQKSPNNKTPPKLLFCIPWIQHSRPASQKQSRSNFEPFTATTMRWLKTSQPKPHDVQRRKVVEEEGPSFVLEFFSKTCNDEVVCTWNPNDPCFDWKRLCFGGLKLKNRGQIGSRCLYPIGSTFPPTRMSKSLPVFTLCLARVSLAKFFRTRKFFAKHKRAAQRWESISPNSTTLRIIGPSKLASF